MTDKKAKTHMFDKPVELDASKTYEVESTSTDSGQLQPASISEIAGNEMTEEYKLSLGDGIDESISVAILLAKRSGKTYWFKFNGTKVTVTSKSSPAHILGLYYLSREGDEIGPYYEEKKPGLKEPKLYDYYFVGYVFKRIPGCLVERFDCDLTPLEAFARAKDLIKEKYDHKTHIADFNFLKTGP